MKALAKAPGFAAVTCVGVIRDAENNAAPAFQSVDRADRARAGQAVIVDIEPVRNLSVESIPIGSVRPANLIASLPVFHEGERPVSIISCSDGKNSRIKHLPHLSNQLQGSERLFYESLV